MQTLHFNFIGNKFLQKNKKNIINFLFSDINKIDDIEKILRTEYTLEEAKSYGFYQKKNTWYDSDGNVVGKLWYVDGKKLIIK